MSIALALCIILSGFSQCIQANGNLHEEQIVEAYKQKYLDNSCYYMYIPDDMNEFLLLDMDTVLDEFEGIKVTKRLLNENLELDINKLNYEDIVMENSTVSKFVTNPDNAVSPMAAIYPEVDGGWQDGTYTVGNGVTSVVVSSEYIALDESGYYFQSVYYLSNDVISDFYMDKNTTSSAKIIFEYLLTTILGLIPDVRSKALSYALSFVFTSSSVVNSNF